MTKKQRAAVWINFIIYIFALVWIILFHATFETFNSAFDPDYRTINLYPYFNGMESLLNMMIFVPVGMYVSVLADRKTIFAKAGIIAATTLSFEIIQYVCAIGGTDIMDIINNFIGGCAGIAVCIGAKRVLRNSFDRIVPYVATLCTVMVIAVLLFVPLR